MYKVAKGRLWLDDSNWVTVKVTLQDEKKTCFGVIVRHNIPTNEICSEDLKRQLSISVRARISSCESMPWVDVFNNSMSYEILASANEARSNPKQLEKLQLAHVRKQEGLKKSIAASARLALPKKERKFKEAVADLLRRGLSEERVHELVKESTVQGVMEK